MRESILLGINASCDFKLFIYISVVVVKASPHDGKLSNSGVEFHIYPNSRIVQTFQPFNV